MEVKNVRVLVVRSSQGILRLAVEASLGPLINYFFILLITIKVCFMVNTKNVMKRPATVFYNS